MSLQSNPQATQKIISPADENILVVKKIHLFGTEPIWTGFRSTNLTHFVSLIQKHKEFLPRTAMEQDPTYKQIIPYLIFTHNNRYFLMQRSNQSRENRLHDKFTLGIGGHIRYNDVGNSADIFAWAQREFNEEIDYTGSYTVKALGIVNDTATMVDQVHIGLVLLIEGNSDRITIRSELKSGQLMSLEECITHRPLLENWSGFVLDYLIS